MNQPHPSLCRILALPGSLRRNSYNRSLLEAAVHCAPTNMRIEIFSGLADVPLFNEDIETSRPLHRGVRNLRDAVASSDGLLIATPEYNQSIPGVLKNAVDWLSRPLPGDIMAGYPIAILGVSPGRWGTRLAQAALHHTLTAIEAHVMPAPRLFMRNASELFDDDGRLPDAASREALQTLLSAFSLWIERTGSTRMSAAVG
ncbi:MAG TPA: NADPH-dependent FMN reductase [Rhodanobacteraceae bacterium]